jgi:hypothetical protein
MNLYELVTPMQWRAGFTGSGENQKPFFFSCGDCGAKDAVIHGFIGSGPTLYEIGLMRNGPKDPFTRLAMLCETCFNKQRSTEETAKQNEKE